MAAVIGYQNVEKAVPVGVSEAEKMHSAEIHSHDIAYQSRFCNIEIVFVGRNDFDEGAAAKVEDVSIGIVLQIGHESKEE